MKADLFSSFVCENLWLKKLLVLTKNIERKKMADLEGVQDAKEYYLDIPQKSEAFYLKGSNALGWGMQNRLARIFNPETGRTVMLAFDHGYFQGATTGLERIDVNIMPLAPYADTLMLTRGILRSVVPPSMTQAIVMRSSGGTSMLKELSNEEISVDIEDSIRMNVAAMAGSVFAKTTGAQIPIDGGNERVI